MSNQASAEPDYKLLFEQAPSAHGALDPNFHIVAVSNAYYEGHPDPT